MRSEVRLTGCFSRVGEAVVAAGSRLVSDQGDQEYQEPSRLQVTGKWH